jgi:flagellar hook-associated protein 1 FlgK
LVIGTSDKVFTGSIVMSRTLSDPLDQEIRVGMGTTGAATDLQALGLRAAVYINGSASDDYVVMVSGEGSFTASASFTASTLNTTQSLRAEPFDVAFTADNAYTITDRTSGSVVATRSFDATAFPAAIEYRGVTLTFTSPPAIGDKFGVDGNNDGSGNNEGMLRMVGLSSSQSMPGGKTFAEAYVEQVSGVGNMSQQALVSKDALTVVYDQAVEARDGISGVSLDEEAANLIRFQQAYQASAKVMQTASTLFDAILALR